MKFTKEKSGQLRTLYEKFISSKFSTKFMFFVAGIASTIWFLVRVIPKPQRAGYPCMRAAAPIMSGFIIYLLSITGSALLFKKAVSKFKQAKYLSVVFALIVIAVLAVVYNVEIPEKSYAKAPSFVKGVLPDAPNTPMGTGIGVFPGRVIWSWNPDATNENCKNTITDAYFMKRNNNQDTIYSMADKSIMELGGKTTVIDAWDALFKNFNERKTGTASGYEDGQTIFIKINNGQAGWAINYSDLSETGTTSEMTGTRNCAMSGTTPATVLAIIRQLVDEVGVAQTDIYVGEPMTHVYKSMYDVIHGKYPNVKIMDKEDHSDLGRTKSTGWTGNIIYYSDKGAVMPDAITDVLMKEMANADYMINIAALKAHARGGVTLTAKLHFGSHGKHPRGYDYGSFHLHPGLICVTDNDKFDDKVRGDYGVYRVLVDLMGHEKLGRNTVLFIVDGLWGGVEATDMPVKWKMSPFKNDFPSSLFMSQDAVALESVCIDFLRAEADINGYFKNRPFFPAVDDHLHQAADKANWPKDITYDPENDGTEIPSLGVHEHWNNKNDKEYTRNLGTGEGIELVKILDGDLSNVKDNYSNLAKTMVYPNPATTNANISYQLKSEAFVLVYVMSADGKIVKSIRKENMAAGAYTDQINTSKLSAGIYFCNIKSTGQYGSDFKTIKLEVIK